MQPPKKILFTLLLLFLSAESSFSQVLVARYAYYALPADTVPKTKIFPSVSAILQNSRGFLSRNNELAWGAFLTENAELLRWKNKNFVVFQALQEVNADMYNDIGFNPKISTWMEEFFYARKIKNGDWRIGFQHRSKHDIDNGEPVVWDTTKRFFPESRVIILNGLFAGFLKEFSPSEKWKMMLSARYEWFLVRYDSRFPYGNNKQLWSNAQMSALLTGQVMRKVFKEWNIYALAWLNPVLFGQQTPLKANYRAEIGLQLNGEKAYGRAFVAFEHFFDHLYRPFPVANSTLWFGARVSGWRFR